MDHLSHCTVRDETPILDEKVELLQEDDLFLVVSKPASLPVHPCGNFKYNSLIKILERDYGKTGLKCVHRLDRQTSGILFYAKN